MHISKSRKNCFQIFTLGQTYLLGPKQSHFTVCILQPVYVGDMLEGSLAIWIPNRHKIKKIKNPCFSKECRRELLRSDPFNSDSVLMDITETAVFDFLIGNMDRHQ